MRRMLQRQSKRLASSGQAALEYALTSAIMALIASLLYLVYQPVVYSVFFPNDSVDHSTGLTKKDSGMGMRDLMYLPIP